MRKAKSKASVLLTAILMLASLTTAQNNRASPPAIQDFNADLADSPTPKIRIDSIYPNRGPMTGETHVIVRGGPFGKWQTQYPKPMCKFGGKVIRGTYVTCTATQLNTQDKENIKDDRSHTCVQCDNNPESTNEGYIKFQVSVTGDFSDSVNSVDFEYFTQITLEKIFPKYGPKDGWDEAWGKDDIIIQGQNFKQIKGETLISFGTHAVVATVINSTHLTCKSPQSDVVAKPIPISISQNGAQYSPSTLYYYYYNWPQITEVEPERGPEAGGTVITLKGRNFDPFREVKDQVDNSPDVYCSFSPQNLKRPAKIISSTIATCIAPPSYYYHQSMVELTLNDFIYTNDQNVFYFYKPPTLYDIKPREGPLHGGTTIRVDGAGFNEKDEIKAKIGNKIVNGTFINNQELVFVAPPGDISGWTTIVISNKPGLWSTPLPYLYYEVPIVSSIGPLCGPDTGYTQLAVTGKNFVDLGSNKAMCVFNGTVFTNATVMDNNLLYCDSPPFLDNQGYSRMGLNADRDDFYIVKITLDGGNQVHGDGFLFYYYRQAKVMDVYPFGGPLSGGSSVTINVTGLAQQSVCDLKVRFATFEVAPTKLNDDQLQVSSPSAAFPGTVVVQVAFNGQQFSSERIIGEKDPQSSFEYFTNPIISYHSPSQGPSSGNTLVKIAGTGFKGFIPQDFMGDPVPQNQVWARLVDPNTRSPLAPVIQINDFNDNEITFSTPPQPAGTNALLQISRNNQDWQDVKDPSPLVPYSFQYYQSPHITVLNPIYGPVKNPGNINLTLTGSNFVCPNGDCSKIFVKFFDTKLNKIIVPGTLTSSNSVVCSIPKYTKPDVLGVEITFNGVDYTSDNKTYGYYDPYLIDVKPRLIARDGSTKLTLIGLGFADSGEISVSFNNVSNPISCNGQTCSQPGTYLDSHTVRTNTLPQSAIGYKTSQKGVSIGNDPFTVGIAIYNDQYNDNNIQVHYYSDVSYQVLSPLQSPANTEDDLKVQLKLNPDDAEIIKKYGNPKVRFTTPNNFTSINDCFINFAEGQHDSPIMTCEVPHWNPARGSNVKMDFSINGQDFYGSYDFTFTENLILDRIVPMAGPITAASSPLRLIGLGLKPSDPALEIDYKWGPIQTSAFTRNSVSNYIYQFSEFLNIVPNNEELKSYWYDAESINAATIKRVDEPMVNGKCYDLFQGSGLQLNSPAFTNPSFPSTRGGPFYVTVGRNLEVESQSSARHSYYDYEPSAVEFFHYNQCTVLSIYPNHGLTVGGTQVQVSGYDFRFQPEYGIVPHCRFGDQIVRAYFDSTVRIVCESPPSALVGVAIPFEVSLNGFDWTDTGFTFSYFYEAEMTSYFPDSGSSVGGTQIYIYGKNFPRINNPLEFNARFTPQVAHMAPRLMAIDWHNDTCISVTSPGGWSEGDKMSLQLTFNGVDYDQHNFTFTMFDIKQMVPRSGPSNGLGGDILVKGEGFRPEQRYLCRLNGTVYDAVSFNWTEIRCPMVKAQDGDDFFGNVDFAVSANGGSEWHTFAGGFQYYQQPTVIDIFPKTGPAHGIGIVNFYGFMFRTDYSLSQLACRIGQTIGTAVFVSDQQIRCVVEDMESVPEGQRLSAQVALNGYSWTLSTEETSFVPYSVNAIFPTSGPTAGGSDVIVVGSGFVNDGQNQPRCRFGTPSNYAIVEAVIISYNKLSCIAPPAFQTKQQEVTPFETPFSVALTQDNFDPWTQTYHRFRYYKQPVISQIYPEEVEVGLITEVLATIDPSSGVDNVFFLPAPSEVGRYDPTGETKSDDIVTALFSNAQIKCRFGRFGETLAVVVNSTALKCVTPSVTDDPEDIYREKVKFTLAMNGFDFDDDTSTNDFTFVGTGYSLGLLPQILGILLIGVLIVAGIIFIQNYYVYLSSALDSRPARPYVADFGNDTIQQRALRVVHGSRSGQSFSRGAESIGRFQDPEIRPQSRIPSFSPLS